MANLNSVVITISNLLSGETYESRSYPNSDFDNNGRIEKYKTPVYKIFIENNKINQKKSWKGLRFMPYWNDPSVPDIRYKKRGFVNSGLSSLSKKVVTYYNPFYGTHNRFSRFSGAIQIKGNFLIHAGPETLNESGWGAAGCVEIIGNFDSFKDDIRDLSGSKKTNSHDAISELVSAQKLFVKVDFAVPPNYKNNIIGDF